MESKRKLILVTGANGFIAARTVEAFLKADYDVRGTVRSVRSGVAIKEALSEYVKTGRFEVVIIEDITIQGAFDEAVKGCYGIAHLAAPVSLSFSDPVPVLHGAINGTLRLLEGAHKFGHDVKTVVLMSSIVAITSPREPGHVYSEKDWNESSQEEVARLGKGASSIDIYAASKTAAERAFWKFRDDNRPAFTMAAVNPALVGGPPLLLPEDPKDINETVRDVYKILAGNPLPRTIGTGTIVDVRDVARLLVFVISHPDETNGERYLAAAGAGSSKAVSDILRHHYVDRQDKIQTGTPDADTKPDFDISWLLDTSKAVKTTGTPWIKFDESVLAAAKSFERYL